ncbi:hypothetical protein FRB94_009718 [Tulasnella sp. JGI-2019a]|nr:hypothetical protein FRB94_009718 [Tulasnella sp. JGI-2019a]
MFYPFKGIPSRLQLKRAYTPARADWKFLYFTDMVKEGNSIGTDFAGDVVQIGENANGKGVELDDFVAGFVLAHSDPANAAFQGYVKIRPESTIVLPKGKLSYEQAATLAAASATAAQGLFHRLKLPQPWLPAKEPLPVLIWGGSTSVGMYAIKLAKLSGLLVAATASPRNHDLLKKFGADIVFDYRDPEAPRLIKEWSHGKITSALDAISEKDSTQLCAKAFGEAGGKIASVGLVLGDHGVANVEVVQIQVGAGNNPARPTEFALMSEWYRRLPQYLSELNGIPLKVWDGGLDGVSEALDYMKAGKVSAEKVIINIA